MNVPSVILAMLVNDLRIGAKTADDINAMADWLEQRGETEEAHLVRCALIYENETPQREWEARKRRERLEIVPSPDGGN